MSLKLVAAAAADLVTVAEAKAQARVDHEEDDALIAAQIAAAVGYLDGRNGVLGRCLLSSGWELGVPTWFDRITLPFPDVSEAAVTYLDADGDEQAVDPALYEIVEGPLGADLRFKSEFTWPALDGDLLEPVTVAFTAGYGDTANDVPPALVQAVKLMVAHWFENREAVAGTVVAELPLGVRALIAPYRMVGP